MRAGSIPRLCGGKRPGGCLLWHSGLASLRCGHTGRAPWSSHTTAPVLPSWSLERWTCGFWADPDLAHGDPQSPLSWGINKGRKEAQITYTVLRGNLKSAAPLHPHSKMTPKAAVPVGPEPTSLCPWAQPGLVSCGVADGRGFSDPWGMGVLEGGRAETIAPTLFLLLPLPGLGNKRLSWAAPKDCPHCLTPRVPLSEGSSAMLNELAFYSRDYKV